jgi:hypothetical protein
LGMADGDGHYAVRDRSPDRCPSLTPPRVRRGFVISVTCVTVRGPDGLAAHVGISVASPIKTIVAKASASVFSSLIRANLPKGSDAMSPV